MSSTFVTDELNEYLKKAPDFLWSIKKSRLSNREKSKKFLGDILVAHQCALSSVCSLLGRFDGNPGKTSESLSNRFLIGAAFMQGVDICEEAIVEGCYSQASALVRQELEHVVAMEECKLGIFKHSKTPNVKNVKHGMNLLYGHLSGVTHGSNICSMADFLAGNECEEKHPALLMPTVREKSVVCLYGIHTSLIMQIANQFNDMFMEMYSAGMDDNEKKLLVLSYKILVKEEILVSGKVE